MTYWGVRILTKSKFRVVDRKGKAERTIKFKANETYHLEFYTRKGSNHKLGDSFFFRKEVEKFYDLLYEIGRQIYTVT